MFLEIQLRYVLESCKGKCAQQGALEHKHYKLTEVCIFKKYAQRFQKLIYLQLSEQIKYLFLKNAQFLKIHLEKEWVNL